MKFWSQATRSIATVENIILALCLFLMAAFPVLEIISRTIGVFGISGSTDYTRHLTLIVGLLGAIITSREGSHLSINAVMEYIPTHIRFELLAIIKGLTIAVCIGLTYAGIHFVQVEFYSPTMVGQTIPIWMVLVIIPLGYLGVALRELTNISDLRTRLTALAVASMLALFAWWASPELLSSLIIPIVICFLAASILGLPIFAWIGGIALVLFLAEDISIAAISVETYRIVASPVLPTIPLFTLAGYLLAEGGASKRIVELFKHLLGWLPAGPAIATVFVCTFFTTFTGASGVTILAVGGLLLPVLLASGFNKSFSVGLVTATGSLGLLFPPALPIIFYGVISHTPINQLFLAGVVPGLFLLGAVSAYAWYRSSNMNIKKLPFNIQTAGQAIMHAKWEILIPVIALGGIFTGIMTLVETAAAVVVYILIIGLLVHRDIRIKGQLLAITVKSATLLGGILIILSVSMGFTNYLVDAEIPTRASEWVAANIDSKITFLLFLNLFLLIVGCLMDIFSAIMVVVPIIIPMAAVFGVHPLHLGIIFLANLELGYLTPPVGMNLFLSAIRFERPLSQVYRDTLPFFLLLLVMVLIITYVPGLVLWLPGAN
ncbi:MAG: TRAP transporter large permease subunit [Candidatus Marinimicrobia bacterium]|jgi:C4-dicarboxylate transporter, DctM subunit|nr:TRAP transporter large permease subunit [Candidatus Neomarinimicrobiota bacterium]MBT4715309.1 TRAP transporter large permease subunit [Candidatus Neomarinimicrobiota bacterium]MBT4946971.1 TRAP transporter large permease subunit [Candidatus Neomarinimicrobiota bacterium]MBT5268400.1 TRAP transporter large permease subunit [Candidatus Neomarinimicrobiota bacterium]MBT6011191.1 TRAP transporter large permease subunit [Candidatus Neomarinimicrobiota bacterium]